MRYLGTAHICMYISLQIYVLMSITSRVVINGCTCRVRPIGQLPNCAFVIDSSTLLQRRAGRSLDSDISGAEALLAHIQDPAFFDAADTPSSALFADDQ
ncbi:hypothetical protein V3C99_002025 [Haemonchus contortus]|uniref:Uncharacterized protein n=1 Tax=Haemonchus contortus TaxID=6289 RepID=A0A7I5E8Y7_HAECO